MRRTDTGAVPGSAAASTAKVRPATPLGVPAALTVPPATGESSPAAAASGVRRLSNGTRLADGRSDSRR